MSGDVICHAGILLLPALLALGIRACRRRNALVTGNFLVLAFLLSAWLLAAESYYRFVYDGTDAFGLTRTTARWFDRHYRMNAMGFRDNVEYAHARAHARPRVSFVGDSFTAGHGVKNVDERFANVIRREHPEWEVEALASNGLDTGAQVTLLRDLVGQGHALDRVVLAACLNDITDIVPEWKQTAFRVYQHVRDPGYLVRHSYAINKLYYRLVAMREPNLANYYSCVRDAYVGPVWDQQQKRLDEVRELCRAQGADFSMVLFPFMHELGPDYSNRAAHAAIAEYCRSRGVPLLDLLPVYEPHVDEGLIVSRRDPHPNERAHELAAQAIAAFVETTLRDNDEVVRAPGVMR
jgi:lysophospholipase L1-like esterase